MARVVSIAITAIENHRAYSRTRPTEIPDEELYHHLIRTGRFRDPDKVLEPVPTGTDLSRIGHGQTVTVFREGGLGDILMVLLVIRELKKTFPALRFRLATSRAYVPLCAGLPFLDGGVDPILEIRGRIRNVIDLRGAAERHERREDLDRIDLFALECGVSVSDYSSPFPSVPPLERARARTMIGSGDVIALAVRGSTHVRTWPIAHVRTFAELAARHGWTVAVIDPHAFDMPDHANVRNLTGRIGLRDAKAVLAESTFCVSPDSGLQHLAEAVGTRCLALYSTTPPSLRIGHYQHVKAIWRAGLPCVPCFDRGCPAAPCMEISPETVVRALANWDQLERWTNLDGSDPALSSPMVVVGNEARIMRSWLTRTDRVLAG